MRYRDLKDERDAAIARALEAERLSMKSEFDRVTAEFERAKAELLTRVAEESQAAYRRGFYAGAIAMANEYTENLLKIRLPTMPLDVVPPIEPGPIPVYKPTLRVQLAGCTHQLWEKDDQGVECCVFCGATAERKLEP